MPKNIVILFDGTSNEISADRTNVLRLYGMLEKSDRQLVFYDPGVGTIGPQNAWLRFWRKAGEIWGMATGWGLDQNVKDAYRFLVENYEKGPRKEGRPRERDSIYIFGFSRGAYSARVLAGFIHTIGLIKKQNLNLLDYAYRAYTRIGDREVDSFAEVRLYERILNPDHPPIRLLGLFDTVASVIESGPYLPRLSSQAFTQKNPSVESIRHAVSMDERRTMFRPLLWSRGQDYFGNPFNRAAARPQDLREVWFRGIHDDVGGGYPEDQSGLPKVTLEWMFDETKPMGLHYRTQTANDILGKNPAKKHYVPPNPLAPIHQNINWAWAILEIIPCRRPEGCKRRGLFGLILPLFDWRVIPEGAVLHASVLERAKLIGDLPPNMPSVYEVDGKPITIPASALPKETKKAASRKTAPSRPRLRRRGSPEVQ
ncbi:hypothetical protein GCM10011491_01570 [Brucella endophytica]|uniref:T6SS Phospholipase effector Tle1-like catalytic domain-containing protein n=1 Tax=Brucella endophytica TaxID=1963359 RepID=A0A916S0J0_9HYPH|nr:DUF2235 domain-containing protein [Brucella endophytica]GGA78064.1 hypothetical protein GCM10011491_01570 [Brucella endophytica]